MNVVGIIAEYNPFHNGHLYHLQQAKKLSNADYTIIIMSGDYVQRGEPAIYDKYTRTKMALSAGADLILELPSLFSTSSAAEFSSASIAMLDQLGVVNHICFGSECGNLEQLQSTAALLSRESADYQQKLKQCLKEGFTFPQARKAALEKHLPNTPLDVLNSPNNILGIEYLIALTKQQSSIKPITITRVGHAYHDQSIDQDFVSATAIRQVILTQQQSQTLSMTMPASCYQLATDSLPIVLNDWSSLLNYKILLAKQQNIDLTQYLDISADLADRINKQQLDFLSFEERIQQLKSKQYTYTRISRALMHLILEIKTTQLAIAKTINYVPYARILGFQSSSVQLLKTIKANSTIPLISKVSNASKLLSEPANQMLTQTMFHSHLYQAQYASKYHKLLQNEYKSGCIKY